MQQFAAGMVVACLIILPLVLLCLHRRNARLKADKLDNIEQVTEMTKLAGELAHEIKNPLSTIKINLKLVNEELGDSRCAELDSTGAQKGGPAFVKALNKIAIIQKETDRLENILDGFLRYLRQPELRLEIADINELVGDMVDFFLPQAYSHSITVRQSLCPQPLICKVDAGALKQVILNIFINAQQAMAQPGELMVRVDKQENDALIQISDTGRGMAPDELAMVFEPYYSSRPDGTGLGLATAKKIVQAHNGKIDVYSETGKGTCFTIRLPLAEPPQGPDEVSP